MGEKMGNRKKNVVGLRAALQGMNQMVMRGSTEALHCT